MTAITYSPHPAIAGQPVTICIDVSGLTLPITLRVHFDYNLGTHDEVISQEDIPPNSDVTMVCFQVGIPSGCSGALVVDRSGQVSDCAITVAP